MSAAPKISIVTAVYNGEQHIAHTLESVLGQSYTNVEYIVIDGGSSDKTLEIINRYREKIAHVVCERDQGIYDALNKGVRLATGDVIGILHADDRFNDQHVLKRIADIFMKEEVDGLYSDLIYIKKTTGRADRTIRYWKSKSFTEKLLRQGWMPPHPTLYLKKSVYNEVGYFNLSYPIAADYDFILRVFKNKNLRFHYLPEVTVHMQVGGVSNRNLKKILEKSSQDYQILHSNGFSPATTLIKKNLSKIKQFISKKLS
jgi:glycosyltransferase involved in cell wall biosynthesis